MRIPALSVALLLGLGSIARAQDTCLEQISFPAVGRWAQYQALYNQTNPYTVRYAVIGTEKRGGIDMKWIEMRTTGKTKDRDLIYQMLVPGSPTEIGNVQEVIVKSGDRPAMKMNGMMMKMVRSQMASQSFFTDVCKDVTLVGTEKVSVPAGKFQARHFHSAKYASDSWVSPAVPFSLVKSIGKQYEMALTAQGAGAKSSLTEEPQEVQGVPKLKN